MANAGETNLQHGSQFLVGCVILSLLFSQVLQIVEERAVVSGHREQGRVMRAGEKRACFHFMGHPGAA
jgi:hypothetical protein